MAVNDGSYQEPSKMTVGEWLDIWARDYLGGVKPMTALNYNQHINNHIKPALGAVKLKNLNTHTIQGFYTDLGRPHGDKPGLSAKTVKCVHGVFHKALQQAVAVGYVRFNPADACELPRIERKEIKPLGKEETSAFLKAIRGHPFEVVYQVTLFTGMRRGEVCGLTWDCVDLEKGTILINKQLQNIPGKPGEYHLVSSKNGKGRTIAVANSVIAALKRHQVQQKMDRLKAGALWKEDGFVFTDELGHHLSPCTVYHRYKRIVSSIGLPNARLHDLRHMKEKLLKRAANLLSVKSLVTLVLTGVFAWMAVKGTISQDFMTIYAVIIAFYFGTQSQKVQDAVDGEKGGSDGAGN